MLLATTHLLAALAACGVAHAHLSHGQDGQAPLGSAGHDDASFAMTSSKLDINSTLKMNSGHSIPILGFGVYQTPYDQTEEVVLYALKTGYRHIDSAVAYRNEAPSASALVASNISRSDLFFTSKIPPKYMSYLGAKKCIAETLAKIGDLGYIDLYLIHAPSGGTEARLGTWKAMVEAVEEGKIKSIGVSNYAVKHLEELEAWQKETEEKEGKGKGGALSVNQVELHPWSGRKEVVEWCADRGVVLEAYSPLTRGKRFDDDLLKPIVKRTGKSPAQVLIRWSLQKGFVPLPKSVTPSRIEENADVYDFELTEEEMKTLETGE